DRGVARRRVEDDERLAALRHEGAAREVRLAAGRRPVVAAERLRGALTEEIHLEGGVDGHDAVLARDGPRIVRVVDRPELDPRVLVNDLEEPARPERAGRDDPVAMRALPGAGDDATLDEVDEGLAEQLRVNAELAMIAQQPQHGVRPPADARLDRAAIRD